jgi:hypothetical protein
LRYRREIERSSWKYERIVKLQKKASWWNRKYRGATNDGSAVKTKVSWRNKRWQRGENINIVAQQKMGIVVKT